MINFFSALSRNKTAIFSLRLLPTKPASANVPCESDIDDKKRDGNLLDLTSFVIRNIINVIGMIDSQETFAMSLSLSF